MLKRKPIYVVVLFDTFALVGKVPSGPDAISWVEACVGDLGETDGEYHRGWSHGQRDVLQKQFTWLPDYVLDDCDEISVRQQKVFFEED